MEGIFHTGVTVSNLDKSVKFYRDVMGLELITGPTEVSSGEQVSKGVGVPNASLRLAIFKVGEGRLELLEYLIPKSPVSKPMPPNTLGAMHVAFRVKNIREEMKRLEAKGIKFFSPANIEDEGPLEGWRWVYFLDPDGISLELVEYHPPKG